MPEYHVVRFDQMGQAVATFAAVDTLPDGSSGGAVVVPAGVQRIKQIRVVLANSAPLGTDSGVIFFVRLSGPGLRDGEQTFAVASQTVNLETTGAGGFIMIQNEPITIECDVAVSATNQISISAAMNGVDTGTPEIGVELVFG